MARGRHDCNSDASKHKVSTRKHKVKNCHPFVRRNPYSIFSGNSSQYIPTRSWVWSQIWIIIYIIIKSMHREYYTVARSVSAANEWNIFHHEKINFISSRHRVIFFLIYRHIHKQKLRKWAGKHRKWHHRYLHVWGYGKYVPDVVRTKNTTKNGWLKKNWLRHKIVRVVWIHQVTSYTHTTTHYFDNTCGDTNRQTHKH